MIHCKKQEGFTLIEIVIAISIATFMMAAVTVGFRAYQKWGAKTSTKASLRAIQSAINTYKLQVGTYPNAIKDLVQKPSDPKALSKWPGNLLGKDEEPEDAWHQPFHYQLTRGQKHAYELYSDGDPDDAEAEKIDVWEI